MDREAALRAWVGDLDAGALARRYHDDGGQLVLPRLLPAPLVAEMAAEARALVPEATRKTTPFLRRAGAVPHPRIVAAAPAMHALHQSPALLELFERVTGIELEHRAPTETHASALYVYTRRGDWMDWHQDECGCAPGDSFSTIVGVIDTSSAKLELETGRGEPNPVRRSLQTMPGTFAFFCGTRAFHRVTPLGDGEERVTFAFTYIRKGRKPGGVYNFRMKLGNTLVYFGFRHLFRR